jgi:hypothetical protein
MTPKEKAQELVEKYYELFSVKLENTICIYEAKHCALIAVDEIIEVLWKTNPNETEYMYWLDVNWEIKKL